MICRDILLKKKYTPLGKLRRGLPSERGNRYNDLKLIDSVMDQFDPCQLDRLLELCIWSHESCV